jgi:acyl-coenzyme A thioesterase PaaI-like protein
MRAGAVLGRLGDRPRRFRRLINWFPAYRGTGGRVEAISDDWHRWRIRIPLSLRTRNYVGTTYGGSLYGAVDPILMLAFLKILGPDYIVWDKAATIRFRRPGRGDLWADVRIHPEEPDAVRRLCAERSKVDRTYTIDIVDRDGIVHADVEKVLHFRRKDREDAVHDG